MKFSAGGIDWDVSVNVQLIKDAQKHLDVDLCDLPSDFELLQRLRSDDVLLVNCLYLICQQQCKDNSITDEDFGRLMAGDVIEKAEKAFWAAMLFFFRGARREQLEKQIQLASKMEKAALSEMTDERGQALVNKVQRAAGKTLDEILSEESFTKGV